MRRRAPSAGRARGARELGIARGINDCAREVRRGSSSVVLPLGGRRAHGAGKRAKFAWGFGSGADRRWGRVLSAPRNGARRARGESAGSRQHRNQLRAEKNRRDSGTSRLGLQAILAGDESAQLAGKAGTLRRASAPQKLRGAAHTASQPPRRRSSDHDLSSVIMLRRRSLGALSRRLDGAVRGSISLTGPNTIAPPPPPPPRAVRRARRVRRAQRLDARGGG